MMGVAYISKLIQIFGFGIKYMLQFITSAIQIKIHLCSCIFVVKLAFFSH